MLLNATPWLHSFPFDSQAQLQVRLGFLELFYRQSWGHIVCAPRILITPGILQTIMGAPDYGPLGFSSLLALSKKNHGGT